jgi:hypothetical protein
MERYTESNLISVSKRLVVEMLCEHSECRRTEPMTSTLARGGFMIFMTGQKPRAWASGASYAHGFVKTGIGITYYTKLPAPPPGSVQFGSVGQEGAHRRPPPGPPLAKPAAPLAG